eukprot:1162020-Pelagomonas_calceolata.AAC.23
MGAGKANTTTLDKGATKVTFKDVAGCDEAKPHQIALWHIPLGLPKGYPPVKCHVVGRQMHATGVDRGPAPVLFVVPSDVVCWLRLSLMVFIRVGSFVDSGGRDRVFTC